MPDTLLPMFPLGTVLLPSMVLPLQVFEPRYLRMVDDVLASEPATFGVVLIERGSEVGGGDVRTAVGCTAVVVGARRVTDSRWVLECVGERRIEVTSWLPDDPYPRALVRDLPDRSCDAASLRSALVDVESALRRVVALASELGAPPLSDASELSPDPVQRSYQLGVLSPLGSLDRHRVLTAPGPFERLALLSDLLAEQEELVRARLSFGGG